MTLPRDRALGIAFEIADSLCRSAYSHDGAVTWMGTQRTSDDESDQIETSYAAVGPTLYSGNSGIALFLAEAYALGGGGEPRFARCAVEGMEHAMSKLDGIPRESRFGFFSGVVGVSYALARIAQLLDHPRFAQRAEEILIALIADRDDDFFLDVIVGAAGGAPALTRLHSMLGIDACADAARSLGHSIVRAATQEDAGWSWGVRANGDEASRDLTGFGHGAGGIGWALFELYEAFGDDDFLRGAREAFRYEDRWYQPTRENWPDFRLYDEDEPLPCQVAWCHGAPGIGLARLRAFRLLGDPDLRRDIEAAVRTTVRTLENPNEQRDMSYTLCHGQGSLAEFLTHASVVLGDDTASRVAADVARRGAVRHGGHPESWAVGVERGSNPSLMLGVAGIGHYYLRVAQPDVPSVLLCGTNEPERLGHGGVT